MTRKEANKVTWKITDAIADSWMHDKKPWIQMDRSSGCIVVTRRGRDGIQKILEEAK